MEHSFNDNCIGELWAMSPKIDCVTLLNVLIFSEATQFF